MVALQWVDTPTADRLEAVNRLLNDFVREVLPDEPEAPVEKFWFEVAAAPSYRRVQVLEAMDGSEVVGAAELVLDDVAGRSSLAWVKALVVAPDHRRRHIGTAMAEAVVERSRKEARERLRAYVPAGHEAGSAFAAALGARTTGVVTLLIRVRTRDLDRTMLDRWAARSRDHGYEYELVSFDGRCPDQWLPQLTEVATVMNTIPMSTETDTVYTSDQILEKQGARLAVGGWGWTVCVCHKPSMRLVGFTELGGTRHRPWLAEQGDTAVHPDHRGRGLSRWIKATNALRLLDERPEVAVVESLNGHVNFPMLSINSAMGFRPVLEWVEWARATS
jgi:mycothiol synthase